MGKTFEKKLPYKKAICYSGYREGQCPTGEMPSKEQISEDLHLLVADGYGYIRMYEPRIWMQLPMRSTSSVFIPTHTIWMLQLRMHLRKQRKASSLHVQSIRISRSALQSLAGQQGRRMMITPIMRLLQIRSAIWRKLRTI